MPESEELKKTIQEYMQSHNVCTIALADGKQPSAHTVYYVSHDLHLYFESDPQSQKIHVIRANPNISLTIDEDYEDWKTIKGIQLFGTAKITDDKKVPTLQQKFMEKFPHLNDTGGLPKHHVFVEVIPEKISYMDYSKNFGTKQIYYAEDTRSVVDW